MLCDRCGKSEATVYVKEIINGKENYQHLCEDCAGGLFNVGNLQLEKLFSNLGFNEPIQEEVCPCCGSTYRDFRAKGRLGCSQCYNVFARRLEPTLKSIHGKSHHLGKVKPQDATIAQELGISESELYQIMDSQLENQEYEKLALQKQLDELVKAENFEEAVVVRDKIKNLDATLKAEATAKLGVNHQPNPQV